MNKIVSNFLCILLCFTFCFGCSCKKEKDLVVYRNFYDQDVTTFNYLTTNKYQNIIRIANLVDGLVENDKYGNIVSSIASSWKNEIIDNKQVWTFYLKDDIYWSDYNGDKYSLVTAHDFVTSLKYILNYNTGSESYNIPGNIIENGMNYYNATLLENYDYEDVLAKINSLSVNDANNELDYYLNIKSIFDSCNETKSCINDFDIVGVKAISDFELQYTLENPIPYFLSSLTYYTFLPVNEDFIKEVGFNNFGTNKKTLLYNGAYLLNDYFNSSRIEYIKNPNYWDKENVFIDKLIFTKAISYQSASYARLMYEAGNITEFYVSPEDETGYKKYVTGKDNEGSSSNPIGDNTYVSNEITDYTTYYFVFNQNRKSFNYSSLSDEENEIANKAMQNLNFRKALTYGLNKSSYLKNNLYSSISSIVPKMFIYNEEKDYYDYFLETYATKNNITKEETSHILDENLFHDSIKSNYYLDLAIEELSIDSSLPIKIEYTYYTSDDYTKYDQARIKEWNNILNGCSIDEDDCKYNKIEIVFNESITSISSYLLALENKEYNLTFLGLYPDFVDPTTYLNAFSSNGELFSYLNHSNGNEIDEYLNAINSTLDLDERFTLCSLLDYYIVFEQNLGLPLSFKSYSKQIVVSKMFPYTKMKATYGLSPFKFKHRKISNDSLSQEDILKLKEEYEKGREKQ